MLCTSPSTDTSDPIMCLTFNGHQIKVILVSSAWAWHRPRSPRWRPRIPRYPALRLTPLSIEFHNWETARFLPGLNKMPLLLQKAEINNYPHADQHWFFCNWYFSASMRHFPLGCFCQKISSIGKVRTYREAHWNVLSNPPQVAEGPLKTPRGKKRKDTLDNGHGTTKVGGRLPSTEWQIHRRTLGSQT